MNITDPFVLRSDVVLVPVTALAPEVRSKFEFDEGDYTISRRHGRMPSQVIDGETAALLQLFRQPRTIVDAVIENSRTLSKDPHSWLEELLPHLGRFVLNGILVGADEKDADELQQRIAIGARAGAWEVQRCVSLIEDTEIYRVTDGARDGALKIARSPTSFSWIANEIEILQQIDGGIAPRLIDSGTHDGQPYLVMEWVDGVEAAVAAARHRHDRLSLLELAAGIVRAYAELHARGVIHSDVHPRNVVADGAGGLRLIDFGLSRNANAPVQGSGRGGMYYFFEPEFLAAQRLGGSLPSSFLGEQYAVGALLYFLLAGVHYLDFRYDREEMARQGEEDPPLPFAARGLAPWPDVERILFRALEKDPAKRFASMGELANALSAVYDAERAAALATPVSAEAKALVDEEIAGLSRGGTLFVGGYPKAPKASINFGAAGAAVALLRLAQTRRDPKLLALAEAWRSRALPFIGSEEGWYNLDSELTPDMLGRVTPYHTAAGVHAAEALIAAARGDAYAQGRAIEAFIAASSDACEELDLTLGRSGTLLACALIQESGADVTAFGNRVMSEIWSRLDERPPIAESTPQTYLGMAHGWSGYLYAALRWSLAAGTPLPARLPERLEELAALRTPKGRGAYWRRQAGGPNSDFIPGWCNGAAGQLFVWTAAHDALGGPWLDVAELAAWMTWEEPQYTADLCCGSAGRAYALLNFYRHTGDREWLSRAIRMANHAAAQAHVEPFGPHSLWKGELGVAVLIADLASPEEARMPFFE